MVKAFFSLIILTSSLHCFWKRKYKEGKGKVHMSFSSTTSLAKGKKAKL
jgi:hypothetical protein